MKIYMVAMRDIVANVFGAPSVAPQLGAAIRAFGDGCQNTGDPNNTLAKHPEDFELWVVGEWDDETGMLSAYPLESNQRKQLAVGANYRNH